jgi:hypothetical protein
MEKKNLSLNEAQKQAMRNYQLAYMNISMQQQAYVQAILDEKGLDSKEYGINLATMEINKIPQTGSTVQPNTVPFSSEDKK